MMNLCIARKLMSKTPVTFLVLIVLALGMTACGDKTASDTAKDAGDAVGDAARTAGDAVGDAAETAGDAVGDAMDATDEFLAQSKDTDVKAARETLDGIERKWNDLLAEVAPSTDATKAEFQYAKDQMAQALADTRAKLVEADNASGDHWQQHVKPELYAALQKTQSLYEDAYALFGNK
jgi:hypothetical protein